MIVIAVIVERVVTGFVNGRFEDKPVEPTVASTSATE